MATALRSLTINDISFVTLPGYGKKNYTEPGACLFSQAEIDETGTLLKNAAGSRVFVAHASPRQAGPEGIDYMVDGTNVGDERIAKMLATTGTKFAIVGNIKEAGGRAATVAGKGVKQGMASEELVLNPGPADATPWTMVDKSVSHGMAAIVSFEGGKASYQIKNLTSQQIRRRNNEFSTRTDVAPCRRPGQRPADESRSFIVLAARWSPLY